MNSNTIVPISLNRSGETISREVERWLSSLFGGTGRLFNSSSQEGARHEGANTVSNRLAFAPRVDVAETESMIYVTAELPGMAENDIEVTFSEGILVLRGERKPGVDTEKWRYRHKELMCGTFYRRIQLPAEVDEEEIKASYTNGLLTITLPKTESAKQSVRKIPVKV